MAWFSRLMVERPLSTSRSARVIPTNVRSWGLPRTPPRCAESGQHATVSNMSTKSNPLTPAVRKWAKHAVIARLEAAGRARRCGYVRRMYSSPSTNTATLNDIHAHTVYGKRYYRFARHCLTIFEEKGGDLFG